MKVTFFYISNDYIKKGFQVKSTGEEDSMASDSSELSGVSCGA